MKKTFLSLALIGCTSIGLQAAGLNVSITTLATAGGVLLPDGISVAPPSTTLRIGMLTGPVSNSTPFAQILMNFTEYGSTTVSGGPVPGTITQTITLDRQVDPLLTDFMSDDPIQLSVLIGDDDSAVGLLTNPAWAINSSDFSLGDASIPPATFIPALDLINPGIGTTVSIGAQNPDGFFLGPNEFPSLQLAEIPEPSSALFALFSAAGLVFFRRRRS